MTPTILTIVRHGETSANTGGVWHGSTDTPLTERGRAQAAAVARHLSDRHTDLSHVYASPLARAHDTARAIAAAVSAPLTVDDALVEYHLGSWEGKTYRELHETHRLWHHIREDPDFAPHGGESPRQVTERFLVALRRIADTHPGERIAVVSHGGALSMVMGALLDGDYRQWRRVMGNCAVSELTLDPEPELLSFDHQSHLEGI